MNRQHSLSKLSTRSLSKIKQKIVAAMGKEAGQGKVQKQVSSRRRLVSLGSESANSQTTLRKKISQTHIPFSCAVTRDILFSKKFESESKTSRAILQPVTVQHEHKFDNQFLKGYAWYHEQGRDIMTVSKTNNNMILRYFSMQTSSEKNHIIAALQNNILYIGQKDYCCFSDNNQPQLKAEGDAIILGNSNYALVTHSSISQFANLQQLPRQVQVLLDDGVTDYDSIVRIMGRKLCEKVLSAKKKSSKQPEIFILLLVLKNVIEDRRINTKLHNAKKN